MFRIEENGLFRGVVQFLNALLNPGCIGDEQVAAGAKLAASKLGHQHRAVWADESASPAASGARVLHTVVGAAGTLLGFRAGCVVACIGAATITVDLLKDGASVLTAPFVIDAADPAYALVGGTIDDDDVVADDVLELSLVAAAGGGTLGKGFFCELDLEEDYQ